MKFRNIFSLETAFAHCDIPCGVYDPSSAKIAARGAVAMIDKILNPPKIDEKDAGLVIGKSGRTITAIKEIMWAIGKKNNARYNIKLDVPEDKRGGKSHLF